MQQRLSCKNPEHASQYRCTTRKEISLSAVKVIQHNINKSPMKITTHEKPTLRSEFENLIVFCREMQLKSVLSHFGMIISRSRNRCWGYGEAGKKLQKIWKAKRNDWMWICKNVTEQAGLPLEHSLSEIHTGALSDDVRSSAATSSSKPYNHELLNAEKSDRLEQPQFPELFLLPPLPTHPHLPCSVFFAFGANPCGDEWFADGELSPVVSKFRCAAGAVEDGTAASRRRAKLVTSDIAREGRPWTSLLVEANTIAENPIIAKRMFWKRKERRVAEFDVAVVKEIKTLLLIISSTPIYIQRSSEKRIVLLCCIKESVRFYSPSAWKPVWSCLHGN